MQKKINFIFGSQYCGVIVKGHKTSNGYNSNDINIVYLLLLTQS